MKPESLNLSNMHKLSCAVYNADVILKCIGLTDCVSHPMQKVSIVQCQPMDDSSPALSMTQSKQVQPDSVRSETATTGRVKF